MIDAEFIEFDIEKNSLNFGSSLLNLKPSLYKPSSTISPIGYFIDELSTLLISNFSMRSNNFSSFLKQSTYLLQLTVNRFQIIENEIEQGIFMLRNCTKNFNMSQVFFSKNVIFESGISTGALISIISATSCVYIEATQIISNLINSIAIFRLYGGNLNDDHFKDNMKSLIIFTIKDSILIGNNLFNNHLSRDYSAAILINADNIESITLNLLIFTYNRVLDSPGSACIYANKTMSITLLDSIIVGNIGNLTSNSIWFEGETLFIFNSSFMQNGRLNSSAKGIIAICILVNISKVKYTENNGFSGAFLYFDRLNRILQKNASIYIEDVSVYNNTSQDGTITFDEPHEIFFIMIRSVFAYNQVIYTGGVFKWSYDGVTNNFYYFHLENCSFSFQRALKGAVANFAMKAGNVTFVNCFFSSKLDMSSK